MFSAGAGIPHFLMKCINWGKLPVFICTESINRDPAFERSATPAFDNIHILNTHAHCADVGRSRKPQHLWGQSSPGALKEMSFTWAHWFLPVDVPVDYQTQLPECLDLELNLDLRNRRGCWLLLLSEPECDSLDAGKVINLHWLCWICRGCMYVWMNVTGTLAQSSNFMLNIAIFSKVTGNVMAWRENVGAYNLDQDSPMKKI